jgi:signal transduction histidine kinase
MIVSLLIIISIRAVVIPAFRAELEQKAEYIAFNLSERIANFVILGDYFQTNEAVKEVKNREDDIEYIFITDDEGYLFAHTFQDGVPEEILSWNPLDKREMNVRLLDTEKGYIRDVGITVLNGMKAEVHIGIREDRLRDTLAWMRYITVPIILLVIFLGVIASIIMSRLITEPLNKFVDFTKVLGGGGYGRKVDVRSGDEIGALAKSFNRLSMELKAAMEKIEETNTYTHLLQAEKLSSVGQISAGLAHELKNPMTSLKMLFQAFKEQPDMTSEDIEIINNEIEKMDNILTQFIGFVKEKKFHISDVNINTIIDRVLSHAAFDIQSNGISVHKDMIETLPAVKADRSLLEQVFLNLIINSVEVMPYGGDIRISGKTDNGFVEVMIWDRGGGIPTSVKAKVFDPFFTTKDHGTGLGLSIAYNIVKEHGGKLYFDSTEGVGTVFTVRLPVGVDSG